MSEFFRDDLSQEPRIKITKDMLVAARIPSDFWYCELSRIPETVPYRSQLTAYVDGIQKNDKEGKCLYLHGPYGSGKTGAACALGKEAIRRGGRVLFFSSYELEPVFGKGLDNALRE